MWGFAGSHPPTAHPAVGKHHSQYTYLGGSGWESQATSASGEEQQLKFTGQTSAGVPKGRRGTDVTPGGAVSAETRAPPPLSSARVEVVSP